MKRIILVTEAPTPHNNFFFEALSREQDIDLELNYIFYADKVPGRQWKTLNAKIEHANVRTGIGRWFQYDLIRRALYGKDIFFIIGWNHPIFVILILLLGLRRSSLLMWFDTPDPQSKPGLLSGLLKKCCIHAINCTHGSIFVTGKLAYDAMLKIGVAEEKLQCLPFFTDITKIFSDRTLLSTQYSINTSDVVLLAAGRLTHAKGYDVYIQSLSLLRDRVPFGWVAILIGTGAEEVAITKQIERLNLMEYIRFIPWSEPETYYQLMCLADIFVAPARFDAFPTTVLLAMQLGKAVIATYGVGSGVEFITSGINGMLVAIDHPKEMADSMEALVFSSVLRSTIGGSAIEAINVWPVQRGVATVKLAIKQL